MSERIAILVGILLSTAPAMSYAKTPLWQGKGRIVISSDGNAHDEDDWGASAVMLAVLAAHGIQNRLPVYVYCDHIWEGHSDRAGCDGYAEMRKSIEEGKEWFGFDRTEFICAYDDPERAYEAIAREINRSSKRNPLILIAAGPMQVLGEGISRSNVSKRQYVTLITHGKWNNVHSGKDREKYKSEHEGWAYEDVVQTFSSPERGGLTCIVIHDQNGRNRDIHGKRLFDGLYTNKQRFDWLLSSEAKRQTPYKAGCWEWLHSRMEACSKDNGRNFDVSDAGMLLYVLSGSDYTSPEMLKELMEHPMTKDRYSR
ncbi:hypothetical protein [uncultured Alistipes sp.]|uniref:hypothetical protein n=1 Tax=uncultured Alistipes sp. TaxID=538949 RepID=UPI002637EB9F|nr:hypothetical protein [uncultured Alistipes sp.]